MWLCLLPFACFALGLCRCLPRHFPSEMPWLVFHCWSTMRQSFSPLNIFSVILNELLQLRRLACCFAWLLLLLLGKAPSFWGLLLCRQPLDSSKHFHTLIDSITIDDWPQSGHLIQARPMDSFPRHFYDSSCLARSPGHTQTPVHWARITIAIKNIIISCKGLPC